MHISIRLTCRLSVESTIMLHIFPHTLPVATSLCLSYISAHLAHQTSMSSDHSLNPSPTTVALLLLLLLLSTSRPIVCRLLAL